MCNHIHSQNNSILGNVNVCDRLLCGDSAQPTTASLNGPVTLTPISHFLYHLILWPLFIQPCLCCLQEQQRPPGSRMRHCPQTAEMPHRFLQGSSLLACGTWVFAVKFPFLLKSSQYFMLLSLRLDTFMLGCWSCNCLKFTGKYLAICIKNIKNVYICVSSCTSSRSISYVIYQIHIFECSSQCNL